MSLLAEAVMFGQVAVQLAVARDRDADGRGDQAVRLARRRLGHDDEGDLTGLEALHALGPREDAALRRKDARHPHQVAGGDAGRPQGQLEGGQLLAVFPDTLGEEHLLRDESDHVTLLGAGSAATRRRALAPAQERRRPDSSRGRGRLSCRDGAW
jgi:hypothetical protein